MGWTDGVSAGFRWNLSPLSQPPTEPPSEPERGPVWWSGGRQLLLGLAAAGVMFGVGRLIGMAITG